MSDEEPMDELATWSADLIAAMTDKLEDVQMGLRSSPEKLDQALDRLFDAVAEDEREEAPVKSTHLLDILQMKSMNPLDHLPQGRPSRRYEISLSSAPDEVGCQPAGNQWTQLIAARHMLEQLEKKIQRQEEWAEDRLSDVFITADQIQRTAESEAAAIRAQAQDLEDAALQRAAEVSRQVAKTAREAEVRLNNAKQLEARAAELLEHVKTRASAGSRVPSKKSPFGLPRKKLGQQTTSVTRNAMAEVLIETPLFSRVGDLLPRIPALPSSAYSSCAIAGNHSVLWGALGDANPFDLEPTSVLLYVISSGATTPRFTSGTSNHLSRQQL